MHHNCGRTQKKNLKTRLETLPSHWSIFSVEVLTIFLWWCICSSAWRKLRCPKQSGPMPYSQTKFSQFEGEKNTKVMERNSFRSSLIFVARQNQFCMTKLKNFISSFGGEKKTNVLVLSTPGGIWPDDSSSSWCCGAQDSIFWCCGAQSNNTLDPVRIVAEKGVSKIHSLRTE